MESRRITSRAPYEFSIISSYSRPGGAASGRCCHIFELSKSSLYSGVNLSTTRLGVSKCSRKALAPSSLSGLTAVASSGSIHFRVASSSCMEQGPRYEAVFPVHNSVPFEAIVIAA